MARVQACFWASGSHWADQGRSRGGSRAVWSTQPLPGMITTQAQTRRTQAKPGHCRGAFYTIARCLQYVSRNRRGNGTQFNGRSRWKSSVQQLLTFGRRLSLVGSGCSRRIPWTGWLISYRHFFLTIPKAGKLKIKTLAKSVFVEDHLPAFSLCPCVMGGEEGSLGSLFPDTDSVPWGLTSLDLTSQKPHLLIPSHRELDFNIEF